jgi:hypothetical protein
MDFLKIVKRRSFLHEFTYIALNIALAVGLMLIVRYTNSIWPAFFLLLLSKWRVLAVRPRYWFANIQSDLVSLIIGISFIVGLYNLNNTSLSNASLWVSQMLFTLAYIAWLLFLRPQAKHKYVIMQAGVALFFGISTIYSISYGWSASLVVLAVWLVGYATARHVLNSYDDEPHIVLLSLAWSLILTEIGWMAYHWTIAYKMPIISGILLPQVSIIALCFGFLSFKAYDSFVHHQKVRMQDILLPLIFTVSIIAVLILAFNNVSISASNI